MIIALQWAGGVDIPVVAVKHPRRPAAHLGRNEHISPAANVKGIKLLRLIVPKARPKEQPPRNAATTGLQARKPATSLHPFPFSAVPRPMLWPT